jgi:hypothetical protein
MIVFDRKCGSTDCRSGTVRHAANHAAASRLAAIMGIARDPRGRRVVGPRCLCAAQRAGRRRRSCIFRMPSPCSERRQPLTP